MRHKLGILSALILSMAIAGSAYAAPGKVKPKQSKTTSSANMNASKTKKTTKHHKSRRAKTARTTKSSPSSSKK